MVEECLSIMPGVGFIRVKLLQCERGSDNGGDDGVTFDPYVAINVKEAVNTPGTSHLVHLGVVACKFCL